MISSNEQSLEYPKPYKKDRNCVNTLRGEYCVMKEDCEQYFYEILERLFENWGGLKILHVYMCT